MRLWTLNKLVVLTLIAGFVVLLFEIRSEHQAVLGERQIAWTPIVYSAVMIIVGILGLAFWQSWERQLLFWMFAVGLIVGVVGFWQHNEEHFGNRIGYVFSVWGKSTTAEGDKAGGNNHSQGEEKDEGENHAENENTENRKNENREIKAPIIPPVFAPLTFAGLGFIGMLACAARFQHGQETGIEDEE